MAHTIEVAPSARAKCRGCGKRIDKGEQRLGERLPNPFAENQLMTHWYHLRCGAYKRPETMIETLAETSVELVERERLQSDAELGVEHRRLPPVDGAQRSPTGRARCRSRRELIAKEAWRIPLVFYEDGRFQPSGFVHVSCVQEYFGTNRLLDRARHFAPDLGAEDLEELGAALS